MLGSSATQQTFASNNSIAVIPQINAEWNYNAFIQPYIVTSTSVTQILSSAFNSTASWTSAYNGIIAATASGVGITSVADTTASALKFTTIKKLDGGSGSAAQNIVSRAVSSSISLAASDQTGLFYKFIFYVKTTGITTSDGFPSRITNASATPTATGSTPYYYRVVGIGANGQTLGIDLEKGSDVVTASTNGTGSVTLRWGADSNSVAYRIYRGISSSVNTAYLTTTSSTSYVDTASNTSVDAYAPAFFDGNVSITPRVIANPNSGSTVISSFIKATNIQTGKLERVESSIPAKIDGWKKVEVWFGAPTDSNISFSSIQLVFDISSEYEYSNVLVDNIELYKITEHDYFLNEYYPAESAFLAMRPGESLMTPGLPSLDRAINKFASSSVTKPVTFGVKSPQVYVAKEFMSPQIQIIPSIYDKFKYYISDKTEKSIQAQYPSYLSINKIVFKYATRFSSLSSGSIVLYTGPSNTPTYISMTSSSFNDSGLTVLYYNGSTWSTSSWTNPPQLTASGTLQNTLNQVRGIGFIGGTTARSSYSNPVDAKGDENKISVIELSPRLELDLSPIVESYSIRKDLTSPNSNGFPLSYINSNSGQISISNIPFYQTSGFGATVFENQAKNATFYGLMRQGVKFTSFLKNTSFGSDLVENVPQFVMYSNTWSINDIGNVDVELFDITKIFAQGSDSPQYFAYQSDLFSIIVDLFAISGFSDYDHDSLKQICSGVTSTSSFWFDESRTIFENLQDILLPHQIGAFIDEYGILRFKSLSQVFNQLSESNFSADFAVTDVLSNVSPTTGSVTYIANILPDSYSESVNEKIGKIVVRYKLTQNNDSPDNNVMNKEASQIYQRTSEFAAQVWKEDTAIGLPSFQLKNSLKINDTYLKFNPSEQFGNNPRLGIPNYSGDLMIGNEIVGYSGMEWSFYPKNYPNLSITKIVYSPSDMAEGVRLLKNAYSASNITSVDYTPTGKIVGLQRGKYGTPVSDHLTADNSTASSTFDFYRFSINDLTKSVMSASSISAFNVDGLMISSSAKEQYNMIIPKNLSGSKYNLFAMDFSVPSSKDYRLKKKKNGRHKKVNEPAPNAFTDIHNAAVGIAFNVPGGAVSMGSGAKFIELYSTQDNTKDHKIKYLMRVYSLQLANGKYNKVLLLNDTPIENVFDGYIHRLSVYVSGGNLSIAINNIKVAQIIGKHIFHAAGRKFGAYFRSLETQSAVMYLDELYADLVDSGSNMTKKSPPVEAYDIGSRYFFTTQPYLNKIVAGDPFYNTSFLYQTFPQALGIKLYDVKHALSPIYSETSQLTAVQYGTDTVADKSNQTVMVLGPVLPTDLRYSNIYSSPFRSKFAVINNTDEVVFLNNPSSDSSATLDIRAKFQKFTEEQVVERVLDPNHANNSIELQTSWLSSSLDANKFIDLIARSSNSFYTDIGITIFGNPLVQVGDFAKLTYSLKRLGYDPADSTVQPIIGLVSSVSQGFNQGVAETQLTIKPLITP